MTRGLWTGIQARGAGYRAEVSRGRGQTPVRKTFPSGTDPRVMQAWRADTHAALRLTRKRRVTSGAFSYDALRRYLPAVKAMPTYAGRAGDIQCWIAVFKDRPRDGITAADIRAVRDRWLTEPRAPHPTHQTHRVAPLSAATVNKRLTALQHLYTVLDGKDAPNPVKQVPRATEPDPAARAIPAALIAQIIAAMPASRSRARILVLATTGWPPKTLASLTRDAVDLEAGIARLPARHKGKGAKPVTVPLTEAAIAALTAFDQLGAWGPFDRSSLLRSFQRAAARAGHPGLRVYDLRHSFLTQLALASRDERAVQVMAQHSSLQTTRRYTSGSIPERLLAAIAALRATPVG